MLINYTNGKKGKKKGKWDLDPRTASKITSELRRKGWNPGAWFYCPLPFPLSTLTPSLRHSAFLPFSSRFFFFLSLSFNVLLVEKFLRVISRSVCVYVFVCTGSTDPHETDRKKAFSGQRSRHETSRFLTRSVRSGSLVSDTRMNRRIRFLLDFQILYTINTIICSELPNHQSTKNTHKIKLSFYN